MQRRGSLGPYYAQGWGSGNVLHARLGVWERIARKAGGLGTYCTQGWGSGNVLHARLGVWERIARKAGGPGNVLRARVVGLGTYCVQGWGAWEHIARKAGGPGNVLRARLGGLGTYCVQGWRAWEEATLHAHHIKRVLSLVFPHLWYFGQKASVHCTTTGSCGQTKPDHQQTTASRTHFLLQTAANHLLPHLQPQRHCMTLPYVSTLHVVHCT